MQVITVYNITCVKVRIYDDLKGEMVVDNVLGGPGKHYVAFFLVFPRKMKIELDVLVYGIPYEVYYPWPGTDEAAHDEYS